jgi:large subunit ribosomal protein L22
MAEETKKPVTVEEKKQEKVEPKVEAKTDVKPEEKKQDKKEIKVEKKKNYALVNANNLHLSTKVGAHICDMIRYKKIDTAIEMIEQVIRMKRAVGMNNRQVGHKHDAGIMAGRYPVDASKEFLPLLKALKANAVHNELELEKYIIGFCKTNKASRPFKRGGSRMKRSHVTIRLELNKRLEQAKPKEKKK